MFWFFSQNLTHNLTLYYVGLSIFSAEVKPHNDKSHETPISLEPNILQRIKPILFATRLSFKPFPFTRFAKADCVFDGFSVVINLLKENICDLHLTSCLDVQIIKLRDTCESHVVHDEIHEGRLSCKEYDVQQFAR
jgi:hypothetical protein